MRHLVIRQPNHQDFSPLLYSGADGTLRLLAYDPRQSRLLTMYTLIKFCSITVRNYHDSHRKRESIHNKNLTLGDEGFDDGRFASYQT